MRRHLLLVLLCWLFLLPCGLYADVVMTDEQAAELDQTLDQLETVLKEQKTEIKNLQAIIDEQQTLCDEQTNEIKTLKTSSRKQGIFSVLRSILISICSCGVGILIGIFL